MNTLNLIKKQIEKAAALHDAQISHVAYRGVEYDQRCVESKESHGTFCYRGKTYTKWVAERVKNPLFFCTYVKMKEMYMKIQKLSYIC